MPGGGVAAAAGVVHGRPSVGLRSAAGEGTGTINKIELEAARLLSQVHSSGVSGMTPPHDTGKSQPARDQ